MLSYGEVLNWEYNASNIIGSEIKKKLSVA